MEKEEKRKKIKKAIIKLLITLLIIGAIVLISYLILDHYNLTNITKEQIQEFIDKTGAWGPIVYMIVVFLQVTFIPIPGVVVILAGSVCFGPWLTLLYCFIAMMLGALLSFKLGRIIGRPFVNWVVGDKQTVNEYLQKVHGKEFVVFFFMFLFPVFPDDALCALAGITPLKWSEFTFMQVISRPISIIGTLFFMSGDIIPFKGWGIAVVLLIAILSVIAFIICFKNADKITEYFNKLLNKVTKKNKSKTNQ